jgi:hypothetical protein
MGGGSRRIQRGYLIRIALLIILVCHFFFLLLLLLFLLLFLLDASFNRNLSMSSTPFHPSTLHLSALIMSRGSLEVLVMDSFSITADI